MGTLTVALDLGTVALFCFFAGAAVLLAVAAVADRLAARTWRGWDADFRPPVRTVDSGVRVATKAGWRP